MAVRKSVTKNKAVKPRASRGKVTMAELLLRSPLEIHGFKRGQKVKAKLIGLEKSQADFNIGGKTEGVIRGIYYTETRGFLKTLKKSETVELVVIDPETFDGHVLLSARHAARAQFWSRLTDLKKTGGTLTVCGISVNDRGVSVEVDSMSAFVPVSQLGKVASRDPEKLVGQTFLVKVLEVDPEKQRLVLSERAVSEASEIKRTQKAIKSVKEGDVFKGVVTTVTSFGVFVEIKVNKVPVEGLVHVSELSWAKVSDPREFLREGDTVEVQVLHVEDGKLALSMKQAQGDPWVEIEKKYKPEDRLKGKIVKVSNFGVFVELTPGIEGLIHMTKIPPGTALKKGQELNCYIEDVDSKSRKISLGLIVTSSKPIGYK
ncbi:MAG: 30S ribosomal protein S1 [Candidatus Woesebacteria bacterium GW2011_GWB1_43_14]|uniref:30S ribosomal protein S1 n=1 Tax=Candidatus Woesebacteria bacterium GW2011_GWB1_43_14 TaxID=1618578 RepID=A0A0G1DMP0_9BACT|nr:MAG: 30S ribosomal protein S1 [Candidatus Woesebacteria bacterium GW2011_GWC1_42_9]KKS98832.1 MAG: 30S ribosomal protein S1 [Candidatus Woesebacteria bacterium GW2011_GWB1_43_14]